MTSSACDYIDRLAHDVRDENASAAVQALSDHLILTTAVGPGKSDYMAKPTQHKAKGIAVRRPVDSLIHVIRGQKVMLDRDLAALYEVPTKVFNQAVRRNIDRFPEDFAFALSKDEFENWRSQIVTSNPSAKMGLRRPPLAFTQEGVAMLSAVLRSGRAVQMSIDIIRSFVRLRQLIENNRDIAARVEELEKSHDRTASVIEVLVEDIDRLAHEVQQMKSLPAPSKRKIGFDL